MSSACPGCNGPKSKRAALCRDCRRRANVVGVSVVTHVHEASAPTPPFRPRTSIQNTIYHGKLSDLAKLEHGGPISKNELWQAERRLKKRALERASLMFGREIESSTEISELEMERVIEWLDDEIAALRAALIPAE